VIRFVLTLGFFLVLAVVAGWLVSDEGYVDWGVAGMLFVVATAGESLRSWLKRSRAKKHQSSGI
jgi:hypothetical protein